MNLPDDRYDRQARLPQVGPEGQRRLAASSVLLVGVGALGGCVADLLARAGVGRLRIADRDVVEPSNLQRQTLFDEEDAREGAAKVEAAARRLRRVNSSVRIEPLAMDLHAGNIAQAAEGCGLIVDGTDNAQTRYLINDFAIREGISWVYGGCVGVEGRAMALVNGGPCLRCIFPTPPSPGELPTCDVAGVLNAAATAVASIEAAMALRIVVEGRTEPMLVALDAWSMRVRSLDIANARRADCVCCGRRRFEFLDSASAGDAVRLCGRASVQLRGHGAVDLTRAAQRLAAVGEVHAGEMLVRCRLHNEPGISLSLFADGRLLVHGVRTVAAGRSIAAKYWGY